MQVSLVYYVGAFLLHYVVPQLYAVHSIQVGTRRPGQVTEEVLRSPGEADSPGCVKMQWPHVGCIGH